MAAGRELFAERGLAGTTVRDLAHSSGIALGTVFNYFPGGKDDLAVAIVEDATEDARAAFLARRRPDTTCTEELFAHVAAEFRALEPCRRFVADVANHLARSGAGYPEGAPRPADVRGLRDAHLATVWQILADHNRLRALSPVVEQLYWTLYLGVLSSWSRDESRGQSETLALLDEALHFFVLSLDEPRAAREEARDVTDHR